MPTGRSCPGNRFDTGLELINKADRASLLIARRKIGTTRSVIRRAKTVATRSRGNRRARDRQA